MWRSRNRLVVVAAAAVAAAAAVVVVVVEVVVVVVVVVVVIAVCTETLLFCPWHVFIHFSAAFCTAHCALDLARDHAP